MIKESSRDKLIEAYFLIQEVCVEMEDCMIEGTDDAEMKSVASACFNLESCMAYLKFVVNG